MNDELKDLYEMKLHIEVKICDMLHVMRVLGGWIYKEYYRVSSGDIACSMCFVPEPPQKELEQ